MKIRNLCAFVLINWLVWCILSLFYFKTGGFSGDFYGNLFTVFFIPGQMSLFAAGLFILSLPFRLIGPRALQAAATAWGLFPSRTGIARNHSKPWDVPVWGL